MCSKRGHFLPVSSIKNTSFSASRQTRCLRAQVCLMLTEKVPRASEGLREYFIWSQKKADVPVHAQKPNFPMSQTLKSLEILFLSVSRTWTKLKEKCYILIFKSCLWTSCEPYWNTLWKSGLKYKIHNLNVIRSFISVLRIKPSHQEFKALLLSLGTQ